VEVASGSALAEYEFSIGVLETIKTIVDNNNAVIKGNMIYNLVYTGDIILLLDCRCLFDGMLFIAILMKEQV
jgi:hypothetical protein